MTNNGTADADFGNNDIVFTDALPSTDVTYTQGSLTVNKNFSTGNVSCSISGSDVTCDANGNVTIQPGESFDFSFTATPSASGFFSNPRTANGCIVDPDGHVTESNENNNTCSNTVRVDPPIAPDLTATKTNDIFGNTQVGNSWTWTVQVQNIGSGSATFSNGDLIFSDALPNTNITYSPQAPTLITLTDVDNVTGTIACSISANVLTCTAVGPVTLDLGGSSFDVPFTATATSSGTFINPLTPNGCIVDPDNNISNESDETNNTCSDQVQVAPSPVPH